MAWGPMAGGDTRMQDGGLAALAARVSRALSGPCRLAKGTPVTLAVSGGADSVAMAAIFGELWRIERRYPIAAVAFCDHGLRDVHDEREAARTCAEMLGVPFEVAALSLAPGGDLQARARRARYRALLGFANDHGGVLATGHTRTDQAETVLMRLLRGTGVRGLAGIAPVQGAVVRPMLCVSREETRALALPYRDDPTNASRRFTRNRVRAELWPRLLAENPRLEEALAQLATSARGTTGLLSALLANAPLANPSASGLDLDAASALLGHLAAEAGAAPSREALAQWADAATHRSCARISLGDGHFGVVTPAGDVRLEVGEDTRQWTRIPGPGHFRCGNLEFEVTRRRLRPDALGLPEAALPCTMRPLAGAGRRERSLVDLEDAAWALVDASGRTLATATGDGRWQGRVRSPGESEHVAATLWIQFSFGSHDAGAKSEVVAGPEGPLTYDDASWDAAETTPRGDDSGDSQCESDRHRPGSDAPPPARMGGRRGPAVEWALPEAACAPTETESARRHLRSGRLS